MELAFWYYDSLNILSLLCIFSHPNTLSLYMVTGECKCLMPTNLVIIKGILSKGYFRDTVLFSKHGHFLFPLASPFCCTEKNDCIVPNSIHFGKILNSEGWMSKRQKWTEFLMITVSHYSICELHVMNTTCC